MPRTLRRKPYIYSPLSLHTARYRPRNVWCRLPQPGSKRIVTRQPFPHHSSASGLIMRLTSPIRPVRYKRPASWSPYDLSDWIADGAEY